MVKKVLLGVALAGLIGMLIFGAANRTLARWDTSYPGQGAGQGYRQEQGGPWQADGYGRGGGRGRQGVQSGPGGGWAQPGGGPADRSMWGRQDGRGGQGGRWMQPGDGPADRPMWDRQWSLGAQPGQQLEWVTLQGAVANVDTDGMVVNLADGRTVEVVNRAWWFARSQGFTVSIGDQVSLHGFYDGDRFEAGQISNQTNGQSVTLRDETGRPMWAGQGNRSA